MSQSKRAQEQAALAAMIAGNDTEVPKPEPTTSATAQTRNSVDTEVRSTEESEVAEAPDTVRESKPKPAVAAASTATRSRMSVPSRTKPVKVTVEMSPVEHRKLKRWCALTAADLELSMVAGAEVLRVLWSMAQDDEVLAQRLREELARTGGSRRQ